MICAKSGAANKMNLPHESLNGFLRSRRREVLDSRNALGINTYTLFRNDMAKQHPLGSTKVGSTKDRLIRISRDAKLPAMHKNLPKMIEMIGTSARVNSQVIQKDLNDDPNKVVKCNMHGSLKSGTRVKKYERHTMIRECAPTSCQRCFIMIFGIDTNLVISQKTVKERHHLRANNLLQDGVHEW